jgi:phosphoglycolate phosphatase
MKDDKSYLAITENSNNFATQQKTNPGLIENNHCSSVLPHPSSLKILLWDIDGTLMRSNRTGSYKDYFIPTLQKVYGSAGNMEGITVSGMTDTQIAYEALRHEGFEPADIFARIDEFIEVLGAEMSRVISEVDQPFAIFDGVREILTATQADPGLVNSLLTGNLSLPAEIKLRQVDLWHFFEGRPGSYGEVSHQRSELAKFAGKQFCDFFQTELHPGQFIVIGDTPNDIACARAFGAKVIAVATGRNHPAGELAQYSPDHLLPDLTDTSHVLNLFKSL